MPVILVPRESPLPDFEPPRNVIVQYVKSGSFNEDIVKSEIIERQLLPHMMTYGLRRPLILLDQAPNHTASLVNQTLTDRNMQVVLIPKFFTNLLQPANVSWMAPLKQAFYQRWHNWLLTAPKKLTFTESGKTRSPDYENAIRYSFIIGFCPLK